MSHTFHLLLNHFCESEIGQVGTPPAGGLYSGSDSAMEWAGSLEACVSPREDLRARPPPACLNANSIHPSRGWTPILSLLRFFPVSSVLFVPWALLCPPCLLWHLHSTQV